MRVRSQHLGLGFLRFDYKQGRIINESPPQSVIGSVIHLYLRRFPCRGSLLSGFIIKKGFCDVFDGDWVFDDSYPLYNSSKCPFAERGFNCLANGRKDSGYLKLRWKPRHCDLPKFSPHNVLESVRGKRVVFVGDSMSRTQWESLICMLMSGVGDPGNVYEVNGSEITKTVRFLGVRFERYNLSVEFFRSVFLVRQGSPPKHGPRRVRAILELDKVDEISSKWVDSDILVFNSGHWWTRSKLFHVGRHFQAGGRLKLGMPINAAFRMALHTWASWVEKIVDTNRTQVFFRTYEPSHWSGSNGKGCNVSKQPSFEDKSEFGKILNDVVTNMRVPVTLLNVTSMGLFRSDAHIGTWNYPSPDLDCSHWCLPGVPDAWNELLFSYLFTNGWRQLGR
ncbi:protein trichome berefringence-like 7 isoform X1 [Ananas comosus]|uniref:Protein trichome berefringence-like 7 isoform X1 n=1 Tax=Ananas comosus TaxID=4615 RepID=A0A6P5EWA6_ANACO|nr:protein trichome berefringence-like 7 isoform X1 [Ananas comosus]XP_020088082.1 protein trichome berefringence-like 7 isoform X1 [Ananas comosus]